MTRDTFMTDDKKKKKVEDKQELEAGSEKPEAASAGFEFKDAESADNILKEAEAEAPAANAAATDEKKDKKIKKKKKAKVLRTVPTGIMNITATYNNTIISLADPQGNVLGWSSAGKVGFRGPKKSTPYAASVVVRDVIERTRLTGLREVDVIIKGVGPGREGAVRAIQTNGLQVLTIRDLTPVPHNGCRRPKVRRV